MTRTMAGLLVSWLYVPGDRPERFDKALQSGASAVILDLEDAVDGSRKEYARAEVRAFVASLGARPDTERPQVHVRINGGAAGEADVRAVASLPGLSGVRVPKVHKASELDAVVSWLDPDDVALYPLVESAAGLAALGGPSGIAQHPRVAGIALGEQDLVANLGITLPAAVDQLRVQAVLAASATGLPPPPMSVYPRHLDDEGLLESTRHGRALGMFGRSAIHPRQVPLIHKAFHPTEPELAWARSVLEVAVGSGATATADGVFVDAPVVRRAQALVDLA